MRDGLYRVEYRNICAGFVWKDGKIIACAPILRKNLQIWKEIAVWICE